MTNQNISKNFFLKLPLRIVIIVLLGFFVAMGIYLNKGENLPATISPIPVSNEEDDKIIDDEKTTVSTGNNIKGNPDASITIIEFSDFECPFCKKFHIILNQILDEYPHEVNWVYRHLPSNFHPEARLAAEASECAAEQGKFWEFAEKLFENQVELGKSLYQESAADLKLNMEQFNSCLSSRKYEDKVEADYQDAIKMEIQEIPASLVNGELVLGAVPYETLKTIVEQALSSL